MAEVQMQLLRIPGLILALLGTHLTEITHGGPTIYLVARSHPQGIYEWSLFKKKSNKNQFRILQAAGIIIISKGYKKKYILPCLAGSMQFIFLQLWTNTFSISGCHCLIKTVSVSVKEITIQRKENITSNTFTN